MKSETKNATPNLTNLMDDLLSSEKTRTIPPKELMEQFQKALDAGEISEESNLEIRQNYAFWDRLKSDQVGQKDKESVRTEAKKTLVNIIKYYLNGDQYQEYAQYLDESKVENNFLFVDVMTKIKNLVEGSTTKEQPTIDSELPQLMCSIILFFDQVSKLPPAKQREFLAQFPMQREEEYKCPGGTQTRRDAVSWQMKDSLIQSFGNVVSSASSDLLRLIDVGNESHSLSTLAKIMGLNPLDKMWHAASTQISAGDAWKFAKSFNKRLEAILPTQLDLDKKAIKKIAELFDGLMSKARNGAVELGDDMTEFQKSMETHWPLLGVSTGTAFINKFFDTEDYLEFRLKKIGNSEETVIGQTLKELAQKTNVKIAPTNEEALDFNLHDVKAPAKIIAILLSQPSNDPTQQHLKYLAFNALWILSQNFAGNSPFNLFAIMNAIPKFSEEERQLFEGNVASLSSETGINLSAILKDVFNKAADQKSTFRQATEGAGESELRLKVLRGIALGIPQNFLDLCNREDGKTLSLMFLDELLKKDLKENAHSTMDWVKLIFYNPERGQILDLIKTHQDSLYVTDDHGDIIEGQASEQIVQHIAGELLKIAAQKQDIDFLKKLGASGILDTISLQEFYSALDFAVTIKNNKMADVLLDILGGVGNKDVGEIFILTIEKNNLKVAEYLNDRGIDANTTNKDGWSALMVASKFNRPEILESLIQRGADINFKVEFHHHAQTALGLAAQWGRMEVMEPLVRAGARINETDSEGRTAIDLAINVGHDPAVKFLLDKVNKEVQFKALATAMNHPLRLDICNIIWDHLVRQGITTDESGNGFAHFMVLNVQSIDEVRERDNCQYIRSMLQDLSQKGLLNITSENHLGKTALELAIDKDLRMTKIIFETLSCEHKIFALNRLATKDINPKTLEVLLKIIEQHLDNQLNPRAETPRPVSRNLTGEPEESERLPLDPQFTTKEDLESLRTTLTNNKEKLAATPSGQSALIKIERLSREFHQRT